MILTTKRNSCDFFKKMELTGKLLLQCNFNRHIDLNVERSDIRWGGFLRNISYEYQKQINARVQQQEEININLWVISVIATNYKCYRTPC